MGGEGHLDAMNANVTGHASCMYNIANDWRSGGFEANQFIVVFLVVGSDYAGGLHLFPQHTCEGEKNFGQIAQTWWGRTPRERSVMSFTKRYGLRAAAKNLIKSYWMYFQLEGISNSNCLLISSLHDPLRIFSAE